MRQLASRCETSRSCGTWARLDTRDSRSLLPRTAIAIAVPKFPRLKEWAYAGMFFDLSGAAVSHLASGDGFGKASAPLILLALVAASWALRPAARVLEPNALPIKSVRPAAIDTAAATV